MNRLTDENQLEKEKPERKLEALLLEGLESGEATPFTHADFEEIKKRDLARLKAKKDAQKS
jgi:Arc/MetJ-type ribon-helix-helix transcriptional regulator